ncbi:exosortase-dependent surface protein XDP1 [Pseudorhodoferax sp.]|uniref:exosortase-dependent surface protein XDP1 n=1 Tax=Pseudorhodoferax sp. TaxID=1993553 RepID=UPI002DD66B97|nr:exosortase-dependent surface protein XDP1 [Pseudorhodoferax sp.]
MANQKNGAVVRWASGVLLATLASSAMASWNFNDDKTEWAGNGVDRTATAKFDGVSATAQAYSVLNSTRTADSKAFAAGTTFAKASLRSNGSSGMGVLSGSETQDSHPDHAVDNNGRTDMVLFKFSSEVILNAVTIGYKSGDADISVLRYTGDTTGIQPDIANRSWTWLKNNGWELVNDYADLATGTAKTVNNENPDSPKRSSWWLVSAFNTGFGGTQPASMNGNDYFKLASLSGMKYVPPPSEEVPEPASLALMGAALMGLVAARRRRTTASR